MNQPPDLEKQIKSETFSSGDDVRIITKIFDAPLVIQGQTWIPLTQGITWLIMSREAGRLHPERSWTQRLGVGALTMPVILGSEWCHNLAHAVAAWWVGKPAEALRVTWGMPMLVYNQVDDLEVTPRQHIIRALGGPVINTLFCGIAAALRGFTRTGSAARDVANAAVSTNAFLVFAGMLPLPRLDGSVILKWFLVGKGKTPQEAEETLKPVNLVTAAGLGAGAVAALRLRKRFLAGILSMFGVFAFLVGTGLVKDKE